MYSKDDSVDNITNLSIIAFFRHPTERFFTIGGKNRHRMAPKESGLEQLPPPPPSPYQHHKQNLLLVPQQPPQPNCPVDPMLIRQTTTCVSCSTTEQETENLKEQQEEQDDVSDRQSCGREACSLNSTIMGDTATTTTATSHSCWSTIFCSSWKKRLIWLGFGLILGLLCLGLWKRNNALFLLDGRQHSRNHHHHRHRTPQRRHRQPVFEELVWEPAPTDSNYDYIGRLQFCQGDTDQYNNTCFGYRLSSDQPCGGGGESRLWGDGGADGGGPQHVGTKNNPLIRMQAGLRYRLILENTAQSTATNLHLHGLHITSMGRADNVFTQSVDPGHCIAYSYFVPPDHMDGVHWYHAHLFGSARRQVNGGAFGFLIVDANQDQEEEVNHDDDLLRQRPRAPRPNFVYNQLLLLLATTSRLQPVTDYHHEDDNDNDPVLVVVNPPPHNEEKLLRRVPHTTANGLEYGATVELVAGEWTRLSVLVVDTHNAVTRQVRFDRDACHVQAVAYDGVWRNRVGGNHTVDVATMEEQQQQQEANSTLSSSSSWVFRVTGASRIDFAIKCHKESGVWYRPSYSDDPTFVETHINEDEPLVRLAMTTTFDDEWDGSLVQKRKKNNNNNIVEEEEELETWIPHRPTYLQSLLSDDEEEALQFDRLDLHDPSTTKNTLHLNITPSQINGHTFYEGIGPIATLHYGSVQQWSLDYTQYHPFHLHGHHMQIVSPGGCGNIYNQGEWFDTVAAGYDYDITAPCVIRFRLFRNDGAAGPILFHCHTFQHATAMGWVNVVLDDDNNINNNNETSLSSTLSSSFLRPNNNNSSSKISDPWDEPGSMEHLLPDCEAVGE